MFALKKSSTIFLQAVIVVIGILAAALLLWEPRLEGVNAHATTLYQIYFDDPFLAYAYTASIAFFIALYQAFKFLGYAGRNELVSQASVRAVRAIKYCAMSLALLIAAPLAYLFVVRPGDDIAGGVAVGLFLIFVSVVVAITSAVFEGTLQRAIDTKLHLV